MAKVGILGGTFDPIHNGHILLANQAYAEYQLDEIWFMPSGQPPHKKNHTVTESFHRCNMVQLAIVGCSHFIFSDFEVKRSGNTYTAQTLSLLHEQYPEHEFFFIVGADSLFEIEHWYHPEEIMSQTTLLVAKRSYKNESLDLELQAQYLRDQYQAQISFLHSPQLDIASIDLREKKRHGNSLQGRIPDSVESYIMEHHLYKEQ